MNSKQTMSKDYKNQICIDINYNMYGTKCPDKDHKSNELV